MQFRNSVFSELTIIEAENPQIKYAASDAYIPILNVTGKQNPQREIRIAGLAKSIIWRSYRQFPLIIGKTTVLPTPQVSFSRVTPLARASVVGPKPAEPELGSLRAAVTATGWTQFGLHRLHVWGEDDAWGRHLAMFHERSFTAAEGGEVLPAVPSRQGRAGQSHRSEPGRSMVRDAAAKDGTGICWVQPHLVFLASSRTGEGQSSPAQCLPQCSNTTPKGRKARKRLLDREVSPGWKGQEYENASAEHPGRAKPLLKKATKIIDFLPTCPIDQLQQQYNTLAKRSKRCQTRMADVPTDTQGPGQRYPL